MANKKRLHYIDVLNCIAIYFVLVLHTSQLAHFGNSSDSNYVITLILQSLCIPAVYIFIMNSGATLLDYRNKYSTRIFLKKRVKRVVIPFIVWSIIYYLYDTKYTAFPGPIFHSHPGIINFINAFANNNINNLFWFFYTIVALYLVTPIISVLINNHKKTLFAIVIACFIFTDLFNYIDKLTGLKIMSSFLTQPLITSDFVGYFVIGYLIKINFFNRKEEDLIIIIGLTMLLISIINDLTLKRIIFINNIGPFFYSVAFYLLIRKIVKVFSFKGYNFCVFEKLSGASLGIYIVHPFFYELIDKYIFNATPRNWKLFLKVMNNPYQIYLVPIITYFIAAVLILFLKKNKYIKILIP